MDTVDIKRLIYTASILLMSYLLVQLYTTIDQRPKVESVNYDSIQIPVINALSQSLPVIKGLIIKLLAQELVFMEIILQWY